MTTSRDEARVEAELLARWPESRLEPSLTRISAVLDLLGSPHRAFPVVHVTGTNGKTSTARMVDELLRGFGLRVGRFTSPHLESVRERVVVDGRPISAERFVEVHDDIAPYVQMVDGSSDVPMSFFEVMVAMAYAAFAETPVDVAVVEVGMGGTWDATNVVDARVAVVTPVSLDHSEYLGPDVASIATEKAGIIKPAPPTEEGVPGPDVVAVLAHQPAGALEALVRRAVEVEATVAREGTEFGLLERGSPWAASSCASRAWAGSTPSCTCPCSARTRRRTPPSPSPPSRRSSAPARPAGRSTPRWCAPPSPPSAHRAGWSGCAARRACWWTPRTTPPGCAPPSRLCGSPSTSPAGRRRRRARQGRRRHARRARAAVRRAGGHPEQLAPRDARRRAGGPRRRRLRRRPGQRAPAAPRGVESAIELAEASSDHALGGSGVLVTGSVVTAGEARTLMGRKDS